MTRLAPAINHVLNRLGVEASRFRPAAARRRRVMDEYGIAFVIDVGANEGQYGVELRQWGYEGSMLSFEPASVPFERLRARCGDDARWECRQLALGDDSATGVLSLASNKGASSSLLRMLGAHAEAAPEVSILGNEPVEVVTLDSLNLADEGATTMLKLDVQGYEDRVLRGARRTLGRVSLIECELSVVPLYEGQMLLREMLDLLAELEFELLGLEPGFSSQGRLLQVNAFLARSGRVDARPVLSRIDDAHVLLNPQR